MARASKKLLRPAATSAATFPSCIALCASIGCPTTSPMAKMCGTLVRICLPTPMKPEGSTETPARSAEIKAPLGRRPTATRIRSKVSVAGAFGPSNDTSSPEGPAETPVTDVLVNTFSYIRPIRLASGATRSLSVPGMSWSSSSTTVIWAPSSWYTVAISSPMIPPPITSSRPGTSPISSAPVESITRGSEGMNGSVSACEPAAMMACSKSTATVPPSASSTRTWCGEANRPYPLIVVTLRCRASPASPPVSRPTTPSFQARSRSRSRTGVPNETPFSPISRASAMTLAACSRALEGMQPTFRQTPPSVAPASTSTTCLPRSAARNAAV